MYIMYVINKFHIFLFIISLFSQSKCNPICRILVPLFHITFINFEPYIFICISLLLKVNFKVYDVIPYQCVKELIFNDSICFAMVTFFFHNY